MIVSRIESLADLANLSLVCARFHQLVDYPERKQYHRNVIQSSTLGRPVAYELLMRLLKYPHLRQYVREIDTLFFELADHGRESQKNLDLPPDDTRVLFADQDAQILRPALTSAGIPAESVLGCLLSVLMCKDKYHR
jgi:hypothetical protein